MKSWQKQQGSTAVSAVQAERPVIPAPSPWLTVNGSRIDLVRPRLSFQGNVFLVDGDVSMHKREHTPEAAYIVNGILVIEELGIWVPLSQVFIGRKTK